MKQEICEHCGEPSEHERFCCTGCRFAFQLIHTAGLEAVYRMSEKRLNKINEKDSKQSSFRSFEIFDHPLFLERRAPRKIDGTREIELPLEGLMCSSCIWLVERLPRFVPAIQSARVNFGESRIQLRFNDEPGVLLRAADVLRKLGYRLRADEINSRESRVPAREWMRVGISGLSAAGSMHIGYVLIGAHDVGIDAENARYVGLFAGLASAPALLWGALPFFRSAWWALRFHRLSGDLLVALAILFGAGLSLFRAWQGSAESYFDALAMVVFLLLIGRLIVHQSTTRRITKTAWWVWQKNRCAPAETLSIGEIFTVHKGEVIALDGKVVSDSAWVNLSAMTGESAPLLLRKGQQVYQGCSAESSFDIVAEKSLFNSYFETLAQKIKIESPLQPLQDFESVFTAFVLILSLSLIVMGGLSEASKAIALLIVSCPCAVQLAYPLAIAQLRRKLLRVGVWLIRPYRALHWSKVRAIYFDKTQTLTEGLAQLSETETISNEVPEDIQKLKCQRNPLDLIIYQLASASQHPLSRSLSQVYAKKVNSDDLELIRFNSLAEEVGIGMVGEWKCKTWSLKRSTKSNARMSTSLFCNQTEILRFYFEDPLRQEAAEVLKNLDQRSYSLHLLSGDNNAECLRTAELLPISWASIRGECTPDQKELTQSKLSALIGDGLNDAPAMKRAATSIGFSGSAEANLQAADVHLMRRDLRLIPLVIDRCMEAQRRINLSLFISLVYNLITWILIFRGSLGPILCAIFMPLSSFTVLVLTSFDSAQKESETSSTYKLSPEAAQAS